MSGQGERWKDSERVDSHGATDGVTHENGERCNCIESGRARGWEAME